MKRNLVIALLPLALGGCLPLPIAIATTAFSGISYLTSGKSTTDHVLSATMEQDCALTRPVFGEPFCRDVGPDGEGATPAMTVASYPGDQDSVTNEERLAARTRGALDFSSADAEAHKVAIAPRFLAPPPRVSVAGIIVTKDQIIPAPQTRALPVAADASWGDLIPLRTVEVAPLAAPVPSVTTAPATPKPATPKSVAAKSAAPKSAASRSTASQPVDPMPVATAAAKHVVAGLALSAPAMASAASPGTPLGADRWVVLGSFRDLGRAKVLVSRFVERAPTILAATIDGRQWHRVAIGPLTPTAAKSTRDGLGRVDGRKPWVVRLAPSR